MSEPTAALRFAVCAWEKGEEGEEEEERSLPILGSARASDRVRRATRVAASRSKNAAKKKERRGRKGPFFARLPKSSCLFFFSFPVFLPPFSLPSSILSFFSRFKLPAFYFWRNLFGLSGLGGLLFVIARHKRGLAVSFGPSVEFRLWYLR